VADIGTVTAATLNAYDVAVLAPATLTATQVTMFTNWVNAGGNLIAMRPDSQLNTLLGLTAAGSGLSNAYLAVDTSTAAGSGVVGSPMQFHGAANTYTLSGASKIATLYSNFTTATSNPAVTLRTVGTSGGHAAAFSYDLATSIVYSRQGNPGWAAQERDGLTPIRSDDKFFGAAASDPQPDWVDLNDEVSIPEADEQVHLLANLILQMNLVKRPLPRFWYFPRGKKAVVVMTGDDHGNGGTAGRFDQQIAASPAGCNVANWECVRSTSYIYVETQNLTPAQAASYTAQGFEVGLHINTNCADFTPTSLDTFYNQQVSGFTSAYPNMPTPITQRPPLYRLERLVDRCKDGTQIWDAAGRQLLFLAAGLGTRPSRRLHRIRAAYALCGSGWDAHRCLQPAQPDDGRVRAVVSVHKRHLVERGGRSTGLLWSIYRQRAH